MEKFTYWPWGITQHPWDVTPDDGENPVCGLCYHGDGDPRCLRCGRSTGGQWACECVGGSNYGPCVNKLDHEQLMEMAKAQLAEAVTITLD